MYPVERYLGTLKFFVRNRDRQEGSNAEAYVVEEALTFVAKYLKDKKTVDEVQVPKLYVSGLKLGKFEVCPQPGKFEEGEDEGETRVA